MSKLLSSLTYMSTHYMFIYIYIYYSHTFARKTRLPFDSQTIKNPRVLNSLLSLL